MTHPICSLMCVQIIGELLLKFLEATSVVLGGLMGSPMDQIFHQILREDSTLASMLHQYILRSWYISPAPGCSLAAACARPKFVSNVQYLSHSSSIGGRLDLIFLINIGRKEAHDLH